MAEVEKTDGGGCGIRGVMGLFWLINFIYTIMFWGGWAILWNFFVPYALIVDLLTKYGPMIRGGK